MRTVKAKLELYEDETETVIVPIVLPEIADVQAFASKLHSQGQAWKGEVFGWQAEYTPERSEAPIDSKMTFTPADFWIGESDVWFYSLMWEQGKDKDPVEYLDETRVLEPFDVNGMVSNDVLSSTIKFTG